MRARLHLPTLISIVIASLQLAAPSAFAQTGSAARAAIINTATGAQPRQKGEVVCYDLNLVPKKTVCDYLPKHDLAVNLQTRILKAIFGGRQPSNPDEAYVTVLSNGQLEFAHTDPNYIKEITETLAKYDILDTYVDRRKVNIEVHVLQLVENVGENLGYVLGARYTGDKGTPIGPTDRFSTAAGIGSILNINFAMGNLVNTLLEAAFKKFKSRTDVKVLSSVPLLLTHGYNLSSANPYSQNTYVATTSVSSVTEQIGISFEGGVRLHENIDTKIVIKDFKVTVSQFGIGTGDKVEGRTPGVVKFTSPVRDLELEIGCSTIIRVINMTEKLNKKEKNFIFSRQSEETESKKDFLYIIQALDDSTGTQPSTNCSNTIVKAPAFELK